jgi:hypothetical protein
MAGGWRKVHNGELRDLYSSLSIIRIIKLRRMKWAEQVARMWKKRNVYRLLVGKPEGKRPQWRPTCRCVDKIKKDLVDIEYGGVKWIGLAQVRDKCWAPVNAVTNPRGLQNPGKLPNGCIAGAVSNGARVHKITLVLVLLIRSEWK